MKTTARILLAAWACALACVAGEDGGRTGQQTPQGARPPAAQFRLRLVDGVTLQPIDSAAFRLVPRRVTPPPAGAAKPQAAALETDAAGFVVLQREQLDRLASAGDAYIDGRSADYSDFVIGLDPQLGYVLTTFDGGGVLYGKVYLAAREANVVLLEKRRPAAGAVPAPQ